MMNDLAHKHPARLEAAKRLSQIALLSLTLLYVIAGLLEDTVLWTLIIIPCLSLFIFLPGMLKSHARSYDWLCFVILIHFCVGVTNSMSPHATWNDYVQTALTVVVFISSMMASRWQKAAAHSAAAGA